MSDQGGVLAGFLVGQQYDSFDGSLENPGEPLQDRGGNPLFFTPDVDLFYANERMGIRVIKYLIYYDNPENPGRSEEHTSELQSRGHLVCRLLLEKKKTKKITNKCHYYN